MDVAVVVKKIRLICFDSSITQVKSKNKRANLSRDFSLERTIQDFDQPD
jgi:hypothetical protein